MRLIDADELKKAVENLVAGGAERLKDYYENGSKKEENEWIGGIYDAWELIDDAPTLPNPCGNPCNFTIPIGKWEIGGKTTHYHYCSICGKDGDLQDNFCRNCGAKMKGEEK